MIFADGAQGIAVDEFTVRLNFYQEKLLATVRDEDQDVFRRAVCLRLVMSKKTFVQLYDWLRQPAEEIKAEMGKRTPDVSTATRAADQQTNR
jgi:hypothetical protein